MTAIIRTSIPICTACAMMSLAEDLTSEVFVEVVRSIAAFRGRSDIKTWMFSIARHQWYQHLRRKKRQIPTESLHDLYDSHFTGLQSPDLSGEVEQASTSFSPLNRS